MQRVRGGVTRENAKGIKMETYEIVSGCGMLVFLAICTFFDIRSRQINGIFCAAVAAVALVSVILFKKDDIAVYAAGVIPGAVLLVVSVITRGAVGEGDAAMTAVLGLACGITRAVIMLLGAFMICGAVSGVMLISGKFGRNYALPFAPFLLASAVIVCTAEAITNA